MVHFPTARLYLHLTLKKSSATSVTRKPFSLVNKLMLGTFLFFESKCVPSPIFVFTLRVSDYIFCHFL